MANNTKKELLEWLALKPRTEGWGAVVSYNRNKCNNLLAQDYINKFTSDSYMPPISEPVPTGDANWEHMHDWVTTYPRLSFEDSSRTAGGEVRMTMAVVGGSQISIDNALGHKRAIAIKSLDALDYPELIAEDVALSKTSGTVGQDTGEVVLDLGDPVTAKGIWELTFANTQHERRQGGQFFKKYYSEADPKKRVFHLGKIAYTDQQYLKPQSFVLRTITAPGAAIAGASNFGDGSVEMFVRMQGDPEGGLPPRDDWRSLNVEADECTVLLSNKLVWQKSVLPGVKVIPEPEAGELELIEKVENGLIKGYGSRPAHLKHKNLKLDGFSIGDKTVDFHYYFRILFGGYGSDSAYNLELVADGSEFGKIKVTLDNKIEDLYAVRFYPDVPEYPQGRYADIDYNFLVETYYLYQPDPETGIATFVLDKASVNPRVREAFGMDRHLTPSEKVIFFEKTDSQLKAKLSEVLEAVQVSAKPLDLFVLNSLLFSDGTHVRLNSSSFPGDLAFFGRFDTPFTITTQDHLMGHGATHRFQVSPEFTGKVKWSVRAVPGSNGAFGTINEDSGVYTSPAIGQIDGTFVRAIVTATDTASTFSSSTLVTVVVRDITVNPVVQICNASPDSGPSITRTLSANTLGEGILEWRVKKGAGSIPLRAGPDGKNTYTAGVKDNDLEGSFTVDEIEVKNLATGKTQTAYIVVNHFPQDLKMVVDMAGSSFPAGKAKLKVTDGRDRPVTADLQVIAGNGSVDSSGMYTSDPSSPHRFALVKATRDYDDSWILLTYPLIELPDKPVDNLWNY